MNIGAIGCQQSVTPNFKARFVETERNELRFVMDHTGEVLLHEKGKNSPEYKKFQKNCKDIMTKCPDYSIEANSRNYVEDAYAILHNPKCRYFNKTVYSAEGYSPKFIEDIAKMVNEEDKTKDDYGKRLDRLETAIGKVVWVLDSNNIEISNF